MCRARFFCPKPDRSHMKCKAAVDSAPNGRFSNSDIPGNIHVVFATPERGYMHRLAPDMKRSRPADIPAHIDSHCCLWLVPLCWPAHRPQSCCRCALDTVRLLCGCPRDSDAANRWAPNRASAKCKESQRFRLTRTSSKWTREYVAFPCVSSPGIGLIYHSNPRGIFVSHVWSVSKALLVTHRILRAKSLANISICLWLVDWGQAGWGNDSHAIGQCRNGRQSQHEHCSCGIVRWGDCWNSCKMKDHRILVHMVHRLKAEKSLIIFCFIFLLSNRYCPGLILAIILIQ